VTLPLDPLSQPDPYTGLPVGTPVATTIVGGDAQMQTRTDLGCAQGGEADDNKDWLRSLRKPPAEGTCHFCGTVTSRRIGIVARQIRGRHWGVFSMLCCADCDRKQDIEEIERRLASQDINPVGRELLEAMLKDLQAEGITTEPQ
jgi:hypothetical protein